jgi:hypothetical protein
MSQENMDLPPPPPSAGKNNIKVITMALICVVLAASLVFVIAIYAPNSNLREQLASKDNTINQLEQQVANLQTQVSNAPNVSTYTDQIAYLNAQLAILNGTLSEYNDTLTQLAQSENITSMGASELLLNQQAISIGNTSATDVFNSRLPYAGYIAVKATSTSSTTYVQTVYSFGGVNFNQTAMLATSGTAAFPVLPATVDIEMGNFDQATSNSTVTITYYY